MFHGIASILFILFIASMPIGEAFAAERLVINLKDNAVVASDSVLLKDVADLRGPDANQLEKLSGVSIGAAPAFGITAVLNRHQIGELLERTVGRLPSDVFGGASAVQIRLQGRQVGPEDIVPILKSHLMKTTPWKESEIVIRSINNLKGIELPPAEGVLRLSSSAAITGPKRILAPIEILHAGKSLRGFWVTADIGVRAEVLTAARRIASGKIITMEDVVQKSVEIADLRASYIRNPEDVIGKASRRNVSSGDPLTREGVTDPLLVKSGETVRLRLERDGIVLTSLGKAEQDGRLGQMIRVRNVDFLRPVQAQVTGRAEATLQ